LFWVYKLFFEERKMFAKKPVKVPNSPIPVIITITPTILPEFVTGYVSP